MSSKLKNGAISPTKFGSTARKPALDPFNPFRLFTGRNSKDQKNKETLSPYGIRTL